MKQKDKDLIIDLLFAKYKENKDEQILDLIKKVEKINFVAEKLIINNTIINTSTHEGDID